MVDKDQSSESQSSVNEGEMSEDAVGGKMGSGNKLLYSIEDVPIWYTTIFLGLLVILPIILHMDNRNTCFIHSNS